MDQHLVRRLIKGLGAGFYGQIVVTVIQLVGVPILLHSWHVRLYGEWLILFALPAYLSLADLGFCQSAGNDMTARLARGDQGGAQRVFQTVLTLVLAVTTIGMTLLTAAVATLPLAEWLHFSALTASEVRWLIWFLGAEVLIKLGDGMNHAGFRATGDYALHVTIFFTTLLVQHASIWITAASGGGPVLAAGIFLGIRALATPLVALLLTRRHRWLVFGVREARVAELRPLIAPALANTALPLAQALSIQGILLVVGTILGPIAVVTFSTLRTLSRLPIQLATSVSNAAEPELAAAFGAGNKSLLRSLYQHAVRAGLWLGLTTALVLALAGSVIVQFWTRGNVTMDNGLFLLLLASAAVSVLWNGSLIVLKAANRHIRSAITFSLVAGTTVTLAAFLLIATDRLSNAGLALVVMDTTMAAYTLWAAGRLCGSIPIATLRSVLNPVPLLQLLPVAQTNRTRIGREPSR